MPLLRRRPFERGRAWERLPDDAEVFYCEITDEIFPDYEEYCERIILVNSMVWSCEITGQSNLTYAEALESEKKARKSLRDFPMELRIPVLYLASRTKRCAFAKMSEDVYVFVKDRYFVGETVEVFVDDESWREAHVLSVTPTENANLNDPTSFCYEVERFDDEEDEDETSERPPSDIVIVPSDKIRRRRGVFTRIKNQLYLKQFVEEASSGMIRIKESALEKYNIGKVRFDQIFTGGPPDFPVSKKFEKLTDGVSNKSSRRSKQETIAKYVTKGSEVSRQNSLTENNKINRNSGSNIGSVKDDVSKLHNAIKPSKRERTLMFAAYMKEWNRIKDDLELEDHKPLPRTIGVDVPGIPSKYFGDFMFIMEFFREFSKSIKMKYFFYNGIDLETLRRALVTKEVAGPLSDIMQMLLCTIFNLSEEEAEEYNDRKNIGDVNLPEEDPDNPSEMTMLKGVQLATVASKWPQNYLATPLHRLPLDSQTFTEILRLHILSSGCNVGENCAKWRYQQRGGYNLMDDPGLFFKLKNPHVLKALASKHLTQLPLSYKLKLIICLINQILTFSTIRDIIEENREKSRDIKTKIRSLQIAERKRETEFAITRAKIRRDAAARKENEKLVGEKAKALDAEVHKKIEDLTKDSLAKRLEFEKKYNEYHSDSFAFQTCLGTDRAFRRYWMYESVEGLFIEHTDAFSGRCLDKPVIPNPILISAPPEDALSYVQKMFELELNGGYSDKENDSQNTTPKRSSNQSATSRCDLSESKVSLMQELSMCTGNASNCPIHSSSDRKVQWSFLESSEKLGELIKSLNKRGIRENELRQLLEQEQEQIARYIDKCPKSSLNPEEFPSNGKIEAQLKLTRKYANSNFKFPPDMDTNLVLEMSLRENLLYLEEQIHLGALGELAVKNRNDWRNALSNNTYDQQCSELSWGFKDSSDEKTKLENDMYRDPGSFLGGLEDLTSDIEEEIIEDCSSVDISKVRSLASALLQIEQAISHKHLKRPLGYDPKELIKDNKISLNYNLLKRWELSLMESTSFAQIFLHYQILENSVEWSKSLLNVKCKICHKKSDDENMLLCDSCNKGFHMYCLKPKLTEVPKGDWFCRFCKPREKTPPPTRKRTRKIFKEEESGDEADDSSSWSGSVFSSLCSVCRSGGILVQCTECNRGWHSECLQQPLLRKAAFVCVDCTKESNKSKDWDCKVRRCAADAINNVDHYKKMLKKQFSSDSESDEYLATSKKRKKKPSRRSSPENERNISGNFRSTRSHRSASTPNGNCDGDSDSSDADVPVKYLRLSNGSVNGHANGNSLRKSARQSDSSKRKSSTSHHNGTTRKTRRSEAINQSLLEELLNETMNHKDCWPFKAPVTLEEAPDYFEFITDPMDFGTIKRKLANGKYSNNAEFMHDSSLVFSNCYKYNEDDDIVAKAGVRLQKFFEKRCKELNLEVFTLDNSDS